MRERLSVAISKAGGTMPQFSKLSERRLAECHPSLQLLFNAVIKHYDCVILCGHRGEREQNEAFADGKSQLKWPDSKHNKKPSLAVDVVPYPVDWNDRHKLYHFAGFVIGAAWALGIKLRWGGDWDGDRDLSDQSFNDLVHFELRHLV